jgi:hypothetical protein
MVRKFYVLLSNIFNFEFLSIECLFILIVGIEYYYFRFDLNLFVIFIIKAAF